jgi:hypothetical protein
MSEIVIANEYTPLPKQRFLPAAFEWLKKPKPKELHVKEQLRSSHDMDELKRLWESTDHMISSQRWEDQDDFKNVERQMGKSMPHGQLIKRVLAMNNRLVVQDSLSMKGSMAFYYVEPDKSLRYTNACFDKGQVPEFTIMSTDAADLPVYYPKYGWRTTLVRLLKGRYITWGQILNVFGDVHCSDSRGKHWKNNVKNFKG